MEENIELLTTDLCEKTAAGVCQRSDVPNLRADEGIDHETSPQSGLPAAIMTS